MIWLVVFYLCSFLAPLKNDVKFMQFPANSSESTLYSLEVESQKDYTTVLHEVLQGEFDDKVSGYYL